MAKYDVLIMGAGPSGLVLANVLALHGVDFRIVDRKSGPVEQSRAAIVHVRTLELLDRLGLAEPAIERGVRIDRVEVHQRGRLVAEFPLAGKGTEALTPFPFALGLGQNRTEQLLVDALADSGRGVEWNTELVSLTDHRDRVQAVVRRADGVEETVAARWVVGADGASSRVRHAVGLRFEGKSYDQTGLLADVRVDLPATLEPGTIRLNLTRGGFVGMTPLDGDRWRLFGAVPPHFAVRDTGGGVSHEAYGRVDIADVQRWFDEYFLVDARLTDAAWTGVFRVHSRLAERFRVGNVFLVGDAAHIHSPAGGQGMNLAIGDAFNLGWKLALVALGQARSVLLDSYEAERLPVARTVLRGSDRGFTLEVSSNRVVDWLRGHVAPLVVAPALRSPVARRLVFRLFSQTWIGYRESPAVGGSGRLGGLRPGDRVPVGGGLGHEVLVLGGSSVALVRPDGHLGFVGSASGLDRFLAGLYC